MYADEPSFMKKAQFQTHLECTMNKDQTHGRIAEVKGKVKEVAGKIVGDKEMELKGKLQNTGGKAQAGYGDVKADIKKATT